MSEKQDVMAEICRLVNNIKATSTVLAICSGASAGVLLHGRNEEQLEADVKRMVINISALSQILASIIDITREEISTQVDYLRREI